MKDFDTDRDQRVERDRSFKIGGQVLTYRPSVSPEALLSYNRAITGQTTPTEDEWIGIYDETVQALLEPDSREQWTLIRNPEAPNPLSITDIADLLQWLFEEQIGRPTGQPSDSSSSSGGNGTRSKDKRSSEAEPSKG